MGTTCNFGEMDIYMCREEFCIWFALWILKKKKRELLHLLHVLFYVVWGITALSFYPLLCQNSEYIAWFLWVAQQKLDQEIKEREEKYSELDSKFQRLHKRAKQRIQEVQKVNYVPS